MFMKKAGSEIISEAVLLSSVFNSKPKCNRSVNSYSFEMNMGAQRAARSFSVQCIAAAAASVAAETVSCFGQLSTSVPVISQWNLASIPS